MKVLYIGHYNVGSTSGMRGDYLKQLLPEAEFKVINIDVPLSGTLRFFRSIGWRYKFGPLITNINNYIEKSLKGDFVYDLVWIDKGVFILPEIIAKLKNESDKLVHFTPDPAFTYHQSKLFYEALRHYDFCVTTKSFEVEEYKKYGVETILCTQGYDPLLHKSYNDFEEKKGVLFIGHKEEEREYIISRLLEAKIPVILAGNHWDKFARKRKGNSYLDYRGVGIYGEDYARSISKSLIGLGLLSKWIPELHTTRTFEIPACETALITERNPEINSVFTEREAIFYDSVDEINERILSHLSDIAKLKVITKAGNRRVHEGAFSYPAILKSILNRINV